MTQPTNVTAVYNIVLEYDLSWFVPANFLLGYRHYRLLIFF
mgnify:CR=1 FL=1